MSMNVTTINRAMMLIIENNAFASILSILGILETYMLQYCRDPSKKGNKQTVKNYRHVSLLQIYGKIFEEFI